MYMSHRGSGVPGAGDSGAWPCLPPMTAADPESKDGRPCFISAWDESLWVEGVSYGLVSPCYSSLWSLVVMVSGNENTSVRFLFALISNYRFPATNHLIFYNLFSHSVTQFFYSLLMSPYTFTRISFFLRSIFSLEIITHASSLDHRRQNADITILSVV